MIVKLKMSALGRGRGWVRMEEREVLRRPGQPAAVPNEPKNSDDATQIINLIQNITIDTPLSTSPKISEIITLLNNAIEHDKLKTVFNQLHSMALKDRQFGTKFAIAVADPKISTISGVKHILLRMLQENYEQRHNIRQKSTTYFRNAASLLGEMYNRLIFGGYPLLIMVPPLLCFMKTLLESPEEEDIEVVATQLSINGKVFCENHTNEISSLLNIARRLLVNSDLSSKSRCLLLYIIDITNVNYVELSQELQDFYTDHLGVQTFACIQGRGIKNSTPSPKVEKTVEVSKNTYDPPNRRTNDKEFTPRAIRGSGATDNLSSNQQKTNKDPRDKVNDDYIWTSKSNTNSKAWGHDDRFDKDY